MSKKIPLERLRELSMSRYRRPPQSWTTARAQQDEQAIDAPGDEVSHQIDPGR